MNRLDVRKLIGEIAGLMDDQEVAHSKEDDLYEAVLRAIATEDTDDPRGICMEALKTKQMDFTRWYA